MGIRTPRREIEYGNDCPHCTGPPYNLFEAGKTPKEIYITFHLLQACPGWSGIPPNGIAFKLTQDPIQKCKYVHPYGTWYVEFYFAFDVSPYWSIIYLYHADGTAFVAEESPCQFEFKAFDNYLLCSTPGVICTGGYAVPQWNSLPRELCENLGIGFSGDTFYEDLGQVDGSTVHSFSRKSDATHVKVKAENP